MKIKNELKRIAAMLTMISILQGVALDKESVVYATTSDMSMEQLLDNENILNERVSETEFFHDTLLFHHLSTASSLLVASGLGWCLYNIFKKNRMDPKLILEFYTLSEDELIKNYKTLEEEALDNLIKKYQGDTELIKKRK